MNLAALATARARGGTARSVLAGPLAAALMASTQALAGAPSAPAALAASRPSLVGDIERDARGRSEFTDTVLVAQDGRRLRFYADVLKDRVVLIHFVSAGCDEACSQLTRRLRVARQLLGTGANAMRFLSITLDPTNHPPPAMAELASRHDAVDPEWLWLSGDAANVELVTRRLGVSAEGNGGLLLGNVKTDRWRKVRADAPPELIVAQLRLLAEQGVAGIGRR